MSGNNNNGSSGWGRLALMAGVAGVAGAGLIYAYNKIRSDSGSDPDYAYVNSFDNMALTPSSIPRSSVEDNPIINNLNSLLQDIYVRYVALKTEDFELHYEVFTKTFGRLHELMKDVDPYYRRYSSTVQFSGSHSDRLRIKMPDEFDMNIVIGLPLNIQNDKTNPKNSDVLIEPNSSAYVQLRMGTQYQNLPKRDPTDWHINKVAWEWKDNNNYLLRSKFTNWFKGVVYKALNKFQINGDSRPIFRVGGVEYTLRISEHGPAITLTIENRNIRFKLDADLVPALKFPENRWPVSKAYRNIPPECRREVWLAVPKPSKTAKNNHDTIRSWRISLHDQEKQLMHNLYNLKQANRLVKKLRDAQGMGNHIASYYIKTLFLWEIVERNDRQFWRSSPAVLFTLMVKKLYHALTQAKILYFWNKNFNLLENVDKGLLLGYARKLKPLIDILDNLPDYDYKIVAKYLLTAEELIEYNIKILHLGHVPSSY